jgi:N-acetylglucosamine-6-phosphate deacetylase
VTSALLVRGGLVCAPGGLRAADVLVRDGRIAEVAPNLEAPDATVVDATGLIAGPGFVDVHVHGGGGWSFFRRDPAGVRAYAAWAPRHGVTSFLVSTAAATADGLVALLASLKTAIGPAPGDAEALGFHLEGPFLSPNRRGAFPGGYLRPADRDELDRYLAAAPGAVRQVTIAPELPGALALIEDTVAAGAVAAMGHSDATVAEARAGFRAGITHVTHLFNAMRPIHQREGGPAVAALLEPSVTCELICDGAHVAPDVLRLAARLLGAERTVVVTDNLDLAGTAGGTASFAGASVRAAGNAAVRDDGTIVGSVGTFDAHFRNAVAMFDGDVAAAFRACAANPARVAGAGSRKGAIEPGMDADIVIIDASLVVRTTICGGAVAYTAPVSGVTPPAGA